MSPISSPKCDLKIDAAPKRGHGKRMVAFVVPHDPEWKKAFFDEASAIRGAFGASPVDLHHIGSTAIPGILAKPIIDILGDVQTLGVADARAQALEALGYEAMGAYGIEGRRYFRKRNGQGQRTHHLHVFETGSPHIERHIAFREYLKAHGDVAADYAALKAKLTGEDDPSWDRYLDGKDAFVSAVERDAVAWHRQVQGHLQHCNPPRHGGV